MRDQRRREACLLKQTHKSVKVNDEVWGWIVEWFQQALSPKQVVAYLKRHKGLPEQTGMSLHHETVCRLIYGDKAEGWSPSLPRGEITEPAG